MISKTHSHTIAAALTCVAFFACMPSMGAQWHVKEAPIRFELSLSSSPTDSSCGYFVSLPDGGILPGAAPLTHVVTDRGKQLASFVMWQNKLSGFGLVFEDPGSARTVYVYVTGSNKPRLWNSGSGLTPSAILCAAPGGSMETAKRLSKLGAVPANVHYRVRTGGGKAPICIEGDLSGHPKPTGFYFLAYLKSSDPGKTWIAPFTGKDSSAQIVIGGKHLEHKKRTAKWGGTGGYANISKGLTRMEIFGAASGSGQYGPKNQVVYLTWRTPKASIGELGGPRPEKSPMAGTSKMETRVLNRGEIARSGTCSLKSISRQDKGPVARVSVKAGKVFWFPDEPGVIIFDLNAITAGNPSDTRYMWTMGPNAKVPGKTTSWLFPAMKDNKVTLTAISGELTSRCAHPFFGFTTAKTSLNNWSDREAYRKGVLNMFETFPADSDPTAQWHVGHWNNFFRCMELNQGKRLLIDIFTKRWQFMKPKLAQGDRELLEDLFLDFLPRAAPDKAILYAKRFEKETKSPERAGQLQIAQAEIMMYYQNDLDGARALLNTLTRGSSEVSEWAKIRFGDVAFMLKDMNRATEIYGAVQNRVRHSVGRSRPTGAPKSLAILNPTRPPDPKEKKKHAKKRGKKGALVGPPPPRTKPKQTGYARVQGWKLNAVLDVAASENVKSLLEQRFYLESKQALKQWERDFPLSKISSDFILQESRLYIELEDYQRALPMLRAYCDQVDASSFVPPAVKMAVDCMIKLKTPEDELIEFLEKVKKRLEFHPSGREIESILNHRKRAKGYTVTPSSRSAKRDRVIDKL